MTFEMSVYFCMARLHSQRATINQCEIDGEIYSSRDFNTVGIIKQRIGVGIPIHPEAFELPQ